MVSVCGYRGSCNSCCGGWGVGCVCVCGGGAKREARLMVLPLTTIRLGVGYPIGRPSGRTCPSGRTTLRHVNF